MTGYSPRLATLSQLSRLDLLALYLPVHHGSDATAGHLSRDGLITGLLAAKVTIPATAKEEYEARLWRRYTRADPAVIRRMTDAWWDTQARQAAERRAVLAGIGG